jgi:phosphoglucosamine mutase
VERLGRAFGLWARGGTVLIGRDTRASGEELEESLSFGLRVVGMEVHLGGVLPTPAVALLADGYAAVISASHNPPEYNGVKFFDANGLKLSDTAEEAIEVMVGAQPPAGQGGPSPMPVEGLGPKYADLVCERFGAPLNGLRVAVDSANGAMSGIAPDALRRLGAEVIPLGDQPNGHNINVGCGATDLRLLKEAFRSGGLDVGIAFDGDGDRMLAVDAKGDVVDGDQILAILALHLGVDLVAVTEMTNLGFHRLMAERGVRVITTDVGDRYVLQALRQEGGVLGGEQSGHFIYLNGHTTGDGLVAAILLCRAVAEQGKTLAELAAVMPKFPQAKTDVQVRSKEIPETLRRDLGRMADELGDTARILVRPSGTEPVIRILAEAESEEVAKELCGTIRALVLRELG